MSALSTIERHGPLRLGDLARHERISKSTVTRLTAKLHAAGQIRRVPDPLDGRSSLVDLTEAGQAQLTESRQRADAYLSRQMAALTPEERAQLTASLPVLERLLETRA